MSFELKTMTEPLALRSGLLRSEASRRVLAASRKAPLERIDIEVESLTRVHKREWFS